MYQPDPNLPPRSKVRLPDGAKKLRKRTRGIGYDDRSEEE